MMLLPTNTDDFNYELPQNRIATHPATPRDSSKLLVFDGNKKIYDHQFTDLSELLPPAAAMVFNNTKVIPARLIFHKKTGAAIQVFCLEPHDNTQITQAMQQPHAAQWVCMVGNARRWKADEILVLNIDNHTLTAHKISQTEGGFVIKFEYDTPTFADALDVFGNVPLPPYLHRPADAADAHTYQTVYATQQGAVAAPTAGLHFTPNVLDDLYQRNIAQLHATLHVGAGTFKPMQPADTVQNHTMHAEQICITKDFLVDLQAQINQQKKIIAVGTTAVRTLESLYHLGAMYHLDNKTPPVFLGQWQAYQAHLRIQPTDALQAIIDYLDNNNNQQSFVAHTQIMIVPGFDFNICDGIITNFHQPQSTLLCLIAAFVGVDSWQNIYNHALDNEYRFLSYGDSSLLWR